MKTAALLKNINNDMRDIEIVSGDNLIGRNPLKNDIVINHQSISSQHAIITFNDNRECHIKDVSSNGTFLNGRRLPRDVDILIKKKNCILHNTESECKADENCRWNAIVNKCSYKQ